MILNETFGGGVIESIPLSVSLGVVKCQTHFGPWILGCFCHGKPVVFNSFIKVDQVLVNFLYESKRGGRKSTLCVLCDL